jgi:hypothetical protein
MAKRLPSQRQSSELQKDQMTIVPHHLGELPQDLVGLLTTHPVFKNIFFPEDLKIKG